MSFNREINDLRLFRGSASEFLSKLLQLQIKSANVDAGAIVKISEGKSHVLVSSVESGEQPEWLTSGIAKAPQALRSGKAIQLSLGAGQKHGVFIIPFLDLNRGTVSIFTAQNDTRIDSSTLNLTFPLMDNYEAHMTIRQRRIAQERIHKALDLNLTVNRKKNFQMFCMELCNEVASRWNCSRVSLGFIHKGNLRLKFISHSEKFSRKMKVIQDLEEAMEECADQDRELIYPPVEGARYIYRQLEIYSRENDKTAVLTLPVHQSGEVAGVLMLERKSEEEFSQEDLETLRLITDLLSPRLLDLEKYTGVIHTCIEAVRSPIRLITGREHSLFKFVATLIIGLIIYLSIAQGTYNIEGSFRMEVIEEKSISAPYEGILAKVLVKPGDIVTKGQLLAEMDTLDLQLKNQELEAQVLNLNKEYTIAVNERNTAKAQIAQAQIKGVRAKKALNSELIRRAKFIAPVDGVILSEDLTKLYRAPVKRGEELFQIGNVSHIEAVAWIPEDQISDLNLKMTGEAAIAGRPDNRFKTTVSEIGAVAEIKEQQNVFKVRMDINSKPEWLRPGMEGLVKINNGRRALLWIWSRKMINWIRMKFWL